MIPILYNKNETNFTHNGVGFLKDAIKAIVIEQRNGEYELSLQYPVTGQFYERITDGCIIKAKANETSELQLFRVYKSSKPLKGVVTYSAEHISYDLNGFPVAGFSAVNTTAQAAIDKALQSTPFEHNFTTISDIATLNSTNIDAPCSVRSILGGQRGSVLDVWGGEYEFDNFVIKLHAHRGTDNGISIEYGKNLIDLKQESNISECYTHLMPFATYNKGVGDSDEEVYVYLTEKIIPLVEAENIGHNKALIVDFSDRFGEGEEITEEKLRVKAAEYVAASNLGVPKINITVSFIQLWQTEEYKNIAPLERVKMCDTVAVRFSQLGVTASAKVIKTVYDSLKEKYNSIELGDAKSSFVDTVNKQSSDIASVAVAVKSGQAQATVALKKAIANATNLITGQSGGYVVLNPAEMPQEILILDAPTIDEAVNVWRWNSSGLGHSSTGYNGEYRLAITADGQIVADFIGAGELDGTIIKADSIKANSISPDAMKLIINGLVSFEDLTQSGATQINGANITTGIISAERISADIAKVAKVLYLGSENESAAKQLVFADGARIMTVPDGFGSYTAIELSASKVKISDGDFDLTKCTEIKWGTHPNCAGCANYKAK